MPGLDGIETGNPIRKIVGMDQASISRVAAVVNAEVHAEAPERLCIQLQVAGQLLAGYGDAVALGNVLPFRLRGGLWSSALLGRVGAAGPQAPN